MELHYPDNGGNTGWRSPNSDECKGRGISMYVATDLKCEGDTVMTCHKKFFHSMAYPETGWQNDKFVIIVLRILTKAT